MSKTLIGCGLAVLGLVVLIALMVSGVYNNLVGLEEGWMRPGARSRTSTSDGLT